MKRISEMYAVKVTTVEKSLSDLVREMNQMIGMGAEKKVLKYCNNIDIVTGPTMVRVKADNDKTFSLSYPR